jgi:hypothetical protein
LAVIALTASAAQAQESTDEILVESKFLSVGSTDSLDYGETWLDNDGADAPQHSQIPVTEGGTTASPGSRTYAPLNVYAIYENPAVDAATGLIIDQPLGLGLRLDNPASVDFDADQHRQRHFAWLKGAYFMGNAHFDSGPGKTRRWRAQYDPLREINVMGTFSQAVLTNPTSEGRFLRLYGSQMTNFIALPSVQGRENLGQLAAAPKGNAPKS